MRFRTEEPQHSVAHRLEALCNPVVMDALPYFGMERQTVDIDQQLRLAIVVFARLQRGGRADEKGM